MLGFSRGVGERLVVVVELLRKGSVGGSRNLNQEKSVSIFGHSKIVCVGWGWGPANTSLVRGWERADIILFPRDSCGPTTGTLVSARYNEGSRLPHMQALRRVSTFNLRVLSKTRFRFCCASEPYQCISGGIQIHNSQNRPPCRIYSADLTDNLRLPFRPHSLLCSLGACAR